VARTLAPYCLGAPDAPADNEPLLANTGLLGLLGLPEDPHAFDVAQAWRPRPLRDRLRVPIGLGEFGQLVELDIKEAAQGGMGPHGLCVGATGSGNTTLRLRHTYWGMSDRSLGAGTGAARRGGSGPVDRVDLRVAASDQHGNRE
jgi:DNA segregation ATPase FtsK/SpoIIIE-like protein